MSKPIDLRGYKPVYWADYSVSTLCYRAYLYDLPFMTRMAAGSLNKFAGNLYCKTTIDELHNDYYIPPEMDRKLNLLNGPHGKAIVRAYAYQQVNSRWWWRCLSKMYPW